MKSFLPIYLILYTLVSLFQFVYTRVIKKRKLYNSGEEHQHGYGAWIIRVVIILILYVLLYLSGNI